MSLRAFNEMFPDEDAARTWFERARWPNGPECYHCGVAGNAAYMPKTKFWHCKACKKQFSVTAGTPMHRTHLPLLSWSRLIGQFGGLFKLFPGCIYAASLLFSLAGASPGKAEISIS